MSAKNGLWVFWAIFRGSQMKQKHIKWLFLFTLVLISRQCFSEGPFSKEGDVVSKFCMSATNCWYGGEQFLSDVLFPHSSFRVDSIQSFENIGSELYGSGAEGNEPLNRKSTKDANKHNNHGDDPGWDDYFHAAILGLLSFLIPMAPVFMRKPNFDMGRQFCCITSPGVSVIQ